MPTAIEYQLIAQQTAQKILVALNAVHFPTANVDVNGSTYVTSTNNTPTNGSDVLVVNRDGTTSKTVWVGAAAR